jgi:cell wall-associated NlpC family hydrolase
MTPRDLVLNHAHSWLGTPWHHMGDEHARAIKGVAVDCAMLLVEVYQSAGLVPLAFDPRPYDMDWALHKNEELFLGWLTDHADEVDTPAPGDVVVWKFGRTFSHGGIVVDDVGGIIHAHREAKQVTLGNLSEAQLKYQKNGELRASRFYRLRGIA